MGLLWEFRVSGVGFGVSIGVLGFGLRELAVQAFVWILVCSLGLVCVMALLAGVCGALGVWSSLPKAPCTLIVYT